MLAIVSTTLSNYVISKFWIFAQPKTTLLKNSENP
jgi:hypothetical protein